ncbi:Octanoyltransferase [Thalassoglobus neptunius]|uniref:Octanoyltransferase n=1 Tax=Thalassoglobus neptunius TaxID=1938619 RepID=A0A5C5V8U6_9PLAN|nr:hypothetical protein [Thalassoglobus neptunius]TWT34998.1 Octanoyltransferase [Thalassoglobus neptunius]
MSSYHSSENQLPRHAGSLEVYLLGTVDYSAFLGLQEYLTYEISGRRSPDGILLLCEHPPLITVGRQGSRSHIHLEKRNTASPDVDVMWVARSGGAFAHAPGQLAVYPILPLDRIGVGLSEFRSSLEQAICLTCRELKVPAKRNHEASGLWGRGGQLGYFGSSVRSWVSNHGVFLNVTTPPEMMSLTTPNSVGVSATSIQAHRLQPVPMPTLRETVIRKVSEQFGFETSDVSTGHPLLKRTTQRILTHA